MTSLPQPPANPEQDEPSVPQLLVQAATLSASLAEQCDRLGKGMLAQADLRPGAGPAPSPASEPDLPAFLENTQKELKEAVAQLHSFIADTGIVMPAGASMEDMLTGLTALIKAGPSPQAVATGVVQAPPASPPQGVPDIADFMKKCQAELAQAQQAMTDYFIANGIDPKNPAADIAQLNAGRPDDQVPSMNDPPGNDALTAMQADALRLDQITTSLLAKIVPG